MPVFRSQRVGTERMARQFRVCAAFTEECGSLPSTHSKQLTTTYNSSSMESLVLFWPGKSAAVMMSTHPHIDKHTQTQLRTERKNDEVGELSNNLIDAHKSPGKKKNKSNTNQQMGRNH